MRYFYARVSTKEQNLDRQLQDIPEGCIVYCDKASGKNMDREQYQQMKSVLVKGDEVFIHSFDRLGRNKKLVKDEFEWFKENGIKLRIKDIPLTMQDLGEGCKWINDMITNLLIEVMSSLAEHERSQILKRQREGIDAMKVVKGKKYSNKTGNKMGRPYVYDFDSVAHLPMKEAMEVLGCSRRTYFERKKEWKLYNHQI